jgi:hypothetical protein
VTGARATLEAMRAARRIYYAAGWWNEHWGRVRTLVAALGVAGAAALIVGGFLVHRYGWIGTVGMTAGALILLFAAIAWLVGRPSRPRLDDDDGPTLAVALPDTPCVRLPLDSGRWVTYCHLEVSTLSGRTVKRAYARLVEVARARDGSPWQRDTRFTRRLRLKWARAAPEDAEAEYRDIEPNLPETLDIVWTSESSLGYAHIATVEPEPIGIPTVFEPGMYRLTVRVAAENSAAVDCTFILGVIQTDHGVVTTMSPYFGSPVQPLSEHDTEVARRRGLLESLGRRLTLGRMMASIGPYTTDEEGEAVLEKARENVREWAASTRKVIGDNLGYDQGALFESDHGLPERYDGPEYPRTEDELERYVARRSLRLEEIIGRVRRGEL